MLGDPSSHSSDIPDQPRCVADSNNQRNEPPPQREIGQCRQVSSPCFTMVSLPTLNGGE